MNEVNILLISSKFDYSTDLVCCELERRGCSYVRINRDLFEEYKVLYDFHTEGMNLIVDNKEYAITESSLKSVYFRAPVFNRYIKQLSVEEQLRRGQWSSFIRNLTVFENAKWVNHPTATYQAENKMFQLKKAKEVGLSIPQTLIGNFSPLSVMENCDYIVKALDTPLFFDGEKEMFTYTTVLSGSELKNASLQKAPVIIQNHLSNKTDIRVTVVGEKIFPAQIMYKGIGIDGDWRIKSKEGLTYTPIALPQELKQKIIDLMKNLNLTFGGIDLIQCDEDFFFIEVNPTGEWGWLVNTAGFEIQKAIADTLEEQ